jgi:phosphodiesterase/alkaline phosphatase D-like protein
VFGNKTLQKAILGDGDTFVDTTNNIRVTQIIHDPAAHTATLAVVRGNLPPYVYNLAASNVSSSGATIGWRTDIGADSQVEYGLTSSYGSVTALDSAVVTSHGQSLTGLASGTLYHYRVRSATAAGTTVSGDATFFTLGSSDTTPPTISGVGSSGVTSSAATISWSTDEESTSQVEYGLTTGYGLATTVAPAPVTAHVQSLSGLSANTLYHYRVKSKDPSGNLGTSADFTFTTAPPDSTPPAISAVFANGISPSAAVINWTTDELSDSQVEYGLTSDYGSVSPINAEPVTAHAQSLSGLTAGTLYHYRVKSKDAAGNLGTSTDFTFTTAPPTDATPPVISDPTVTEITASSAKVNWTTDEASDSLVEYGLDNRYGSSTTLDAKPVTTHGQQLSGLAASTLYHYHVKSKDAAGNLATSGDFTFTTTAAPDTTPPTISAVSATGITATAATIGWATDEQSDSQVQYGLTTS